MGRVRSLRPDFFLDEDVAEASIEARLLLLGLLTLCDRDGRIEDRPRRIGAQLCPYGSSQPIVDLLSELADLRLIERYEVDGIGVIFVPMFVETQEPHCRESPSALPCKPAGIADQSEASHSLAEKSPGKPGQARARLRRPAQLSSDPDPDPVPDPDPDPVPSSNPDPADGGFLSERAVDELIERDAAERLAEPIALVVADTVRVAAPSRSLHLTLLEVFSDLWRAKYGELYHATPPEKSNLGRLLGKMTREQADSLPARMARYIADDDEFLVEKVRHSLGHFCKFGVNKYAVDAKVTKTAAERRQEDLCDRWLESSGEELVP